MKTVVILHHLDCIDQLYSVMKMVKWMELA